MKIKISQLLTAAFVCSLLLGFIANEVRHRRQIDELQSTLLATSDSLNNVQYGKALLRLAHLHPDVWDDRECTRFLKHELALLVIIHWRDAYEINRVTQSNDYAIRFVAVALQILNCRDADEFWSKCDLELSIYPDDELETWSFELSRNERFHFERFTNEACSIEVGDDEWLMK